MVCKQSKNILDPATREFYSNTLHALKEAQVPFLVGGAYGLGCYTGIIRHTKDLDIFIREADFDKTADTLAEAGYEVTMAMTHWLGKAFLKEDFIDIIFSSGNGIAVVDDLWFTHAGEGQILDIPIQLIPTEEMIWSKGFIMERERYDGADVAHLIQAQAKNMDWERLLMRFEPHWQVLMTHLILFTFIYPGEKDLIPSWVFENLTERLNGLKKSEANPKGLCRGTLLSREQYLIDIQKWGYKDARLMPHGKMSRKQVRKWTDAIEDSAHDRPNEQT